MSYIPVREIASIGVVRDVPPQDAPAQAWTVGRNVRFKDRAIRRAAGFRTFLNSLDTETPYSMYGAAISSASDFILYTDFDGNIYRREVSGTTDDITNVGHSATSASLSVTYAQLAENVTINREDEQPWYTAPGDATVSALPGWDSAWTCKSLRAYRGFLIAINVTKLGVINPVLIKTSSPSVDGAMPVSWDHTDVSTLATENALTEFTTELIDGWPLGDDFILYSNNDAMRMTFDGSDDVFSYRMTGLKRGILNANCVVEHDGRHYVFGFNSLFSHDGITPDDIGDGRVAVEVFKYLDRTKADRAFVAHDERLKCILFCYPSLNPACRWTGTAFCNEAVVYNYSNNTFAFVDMPNVSAASFANPATIESWATIAGTWATVEGAWSQLNEATFKIPVFAMNAPGTTVGQVCAYDVVGDDAYVAELALDQTLSSPPLLRKTSSDIDELGATLRDYKVLKGMTLQIESDAVFEVRFGGQMRVKDPITWTDYQDFDPTSDDTVDLEGHGRLVSFEITTDNTEDDFSFTAYDIDLVVLSHK